MNKAFISVLVVLFATTTTGLAQREVLGSPTGINAALSKLFGDVKAFSAKSDVRVLGQDQKEKVTAQMDFALLDEKIRVEVDMTRMRNKAVPGDSAVNMKQFGMDRVVSIIRPDKKATYIIFPGMQSYVNMPMSKQELESYQKNSKVEKTALGKETLDGHPCVKNKIVITDDQGGKYEATVWNATDLKDFPVQIQTTENNDTVLLRYRQIQLAKPEAKQFEPPADFKAYDDIQLLMQGAMMKMMSEGGMPKP